MNNNLYLVASNDKITLDNKLQEIIKKSPDAEIVHYDLSEVAIDKLIEDLDTYNFLSNKKVIVGHNASFLSTDKVKQQVEHNLEKLEKYIENLDIKEKHTSYCLLKNYLPNEKCYRPYSSLQ